MTNNTSTDMLSGSAHLDLAGNLIIKARFNNNFKKTTINNDELTYDELILMLQRLFNGRFDAKDDVKLKYRDEDGDLVDIDNDSDLKSAIQSNRYLKLVISLGDEEDDCSILEDNHKISLSKKEFRKLTETMECILESLKRNEPIKPENSTNSSFEPLHNDAPVNALNNLTLSDSKEFDPLVNKPDLDLKSDKSPHHQASLEDDSIKSLNSNVNSNERQQPATLQPSVQQFQSTQNLQSKILNQSQQHQQLPPPSNQMLGQQQLPPNQFQQPPPQQHLPPPQQQQQQPPQQQHQNQPVPYRYGMPPSNTSVNQPPPPPTSRPTTFNPNDLPQQPNQFNPASSMPSSHPPSSYPTPSSTPANLFNPPQITSPPGPPQMSGPPTGPFQPPSFSNPPISGPPMMSGPPQASLNSSMSSNGPSPNPIQSGPPSAFGMPPQLNRPPTGPPTSMGMPPSTQGPPQNGVIPPSSNQPLTGPPQFTPAGPPTGPYPGQLNKGGNPYANTARNGQRGYAYPQQQQFN